MMDEWMMYEGCSYDHVIIWLYDSHIHYTHTPYSILHSILCSILHHILSTPYTIPYTILYYTTFHTILHHTTIPCTILYTIPYTTPYTILYYTILYFPSFPSFVPFLLFSSLSSLFLSFHPPLPLTPPLLPSYLFTRRRTCIIQCHRKHRPLNHIQIASIPLTERTNGLTCTPPRGPLFASEDGNGGLVAGIVGRGHHIL